MFFFTFAKSNIMSILNDFKNNSNGIYPILPGMTVELGDYGYWDKSRWLRIGNIKTDFRNITFTEKTKEIDQRINIIINASVQGEGNMDVTTPKAEAGFNIEFNSKGAIYFNAELTKELYFPSIEWEIKPFLEELYELKLWNEKCWIAISLVYANNYMCIQSEDSNSKVTIKAKTDIIPENIGISSGFMISKSSGKIKNIFSNGTDEQVAGIKFIRKKKKTFSLKKRNIKYMGNNNELCFDDITEELTFT